MIFNTDISWHLFSIYCFITMITFQSVPCGKCNILDKYPDAIDNLNVVTCRNVCGTFPPACSCQSKCRVLGNCCEDFKQECPEEYNNTGRIDHLLYASVGCYYGVLMVDSTGMPGSDQAHMTPLTSLTTQVTAGQHLGESAKSRLNNLHNNLPVIDLYSGITFANKAIYNHYAMNKSQPMVWTLALESRGVSAFSNLTELLDSVFHQHFYYIPPGGPNTMNSTERSPCIKTALGCPLLHRNDTLKEKCNSFLTYIYIFSNLRDEQVYFRNIYCSMCWNETSSGFSKHSIILASDTVFSTLRLPKATFAIMVRITDTGYTFEMKDTDSATNWKQINCTNSELASQEESCEIIGCPEGLILNFEKMCTYPRRLQVLIDSKEVDLGANYDLLKLSSIFWCLLENRSKRAFIDDDQIGVRPPAKYYYRNIGGFGYLIEANVLWLRLSFDFNIFTFNTVVDVAVKALARFVKSNGEVVESMNDEEKNKNSISSSSSNVNSSNNNNNNNNNIVEATLTESDDGDSGMKTFDLMWGSESVEMSDDLDENNKWYKDIAVIDPTLMTHTCLCLKERFQKSPCFLKCWSTPTFQHDEQNIRQFLNSPCFQTNSRRSLSKSRSNSCIHSSNFAFILLMFMMYCLMTPIK